MKVSTSTATLFLSLAAARSHNYNGYKVFRLNTGPGNISEFLKNELNDFEYHVHDSTPLGDLSVAIAPDNITAFEALRLEASVLHEDLGADIEAESGWGKLSVNEYTFAEADAYTDNKWELHPCFRAKGQWFEDWFTTYHQFYEHMDFWDAVLSCFPGHSENKKIGETFQSRDIRAIHLWGAPGKESSDPPPALYFQANALGRDWIATAVAEYVMLRLINDYLRGDEHAVEMLDQNDFYFVPVVNPDGFAETQQDDRKWRKNLQMRQKSSCPGTNLNRNWPAYWGYLPKDDLSFFSCMPEFRGDKPSDSPEVATYIRFINNILGDDLTKPKAQVIKLFIDWQAGGQRVLWPFHSKNHKFYKEDQHSKIADGFKRNLKRACTRGKYDNCKPWEVGRASKLAGDLSGTALDYMALKIEPKLGKVEYAFAIQVRSKDGKFIVQREEILPSGEEQYAVVKHFALYRHIDGL
ncbi:hypothetical protein VPNG_06735 [Cytospora leucostoma]|uniref:Peptidase M14 domain-containing protein n=1 Tax=Cytospora leucostoma TaxID=1230097 RepID=A0A423WT27_9PEZI|nr:hypothetical protein VPNG_06735 [Cytospora leucostoma]